MPNLLVSLLRLKCPRCREGNMFTQKGIWPLKTMMDMPERCTLCGQRMELETGFYFGTGYVSYALSIAILVSCFVAYHILLGLTWKNKSILTCLCISIGLLVLLQPVLMRLSRTIYLSMFVKYEPKWKEKQQ